MSKDERKVVDANNMKAVQLAPNPDYLSEADFISSDGTYRDLKAKIEGVTIEEFPIPGTSKSEMQPVLSFAGKHKRLVIGAKTNRLKLKGKFGDHTSKWKGGEITLYFDPEVTFGRKVVGGIRIR